MGKPSPDYEALKRARAKPERTWFISRKMFWLNATWPGEWGVSTDWNEISFGAGTPAVKFNGPEVPEHVLSVWFRFWRFGMMVFWRRQLIMELGDRKCKAKSRK